MHRWQRVAAVVLEAVTTLIFVYFFISGILDFYRFCRSYPSERSDTHLGFTCSVYFVDSLSNAFDVLLLFCFVAAVLAWVAFFLSSAQNIMFTNGFVSYLSGTAEMQYESLDRVQSAFSSAYAAVEAYGQICAALIMLSGLRLLRQFGQKRMAILFFTVTDALEQLSYVFFLVFFLFVGLSFMCYFSFGYCVSSFSTVKKSFFGAFLLLLGTFPVNEVFRANLPIAALALFPSLFFVGVVCLACFLCVLLRSFFARVAEVEKAELLLQKQQGYTGEERADSGMHRWCRQLLCIRRKKGAEGFRRGRLHSPEMAALQSRQDAQISEGTTPQQRQLLADDEVSVDEFEEMREMDLRARRLRQKPVKVAEIPKEVVTSQLTDEQWRMLPVQVCSWAQSEVDSFNALFRKLQMLSALAGSEKLAFVRQIEMDLYHQLSTCDREVEQQEAFLSNRLSIYKNRTVLEQEKLTNYVKYLERALEDREREVELLRNEVDLVQNKTEELTVEQGRGLNNAPL